MWEKKRGKTQSIYSSEPQISVMVSNIFLIKSLPNITKWQNGSISTVSFCLQLISWLTLSKPIWHSLFPVV